MKLKNYSILLILFLSILNSYAQCPITSSSGTTYTFGHSSGSMSVVVDNSLIVDNSVTSDALKVFIDDGFIAGDVLSFNGTLPSGVSASYDSTSGILTVSGATMTASQIQSILRAVEISSTSTVTSSREVVFVLGSALPLSTNGHYYEFVASPQILWTDAKTASDAKTFFGLQGYLATITSSDETNFLLEKVSGDGWIGANDVATDNTWQWVTGPEAGTSFWQGTASGSPIGGAYTNWNTNQPDNSGGAEHWMQFYKNGTSIDGRWNDLNNIPYSFINGYLVEYGGMPGDPTCGPSVERTVSFAGDSDTDTDGDGLSDANEILIGSDPNLFEDNDGDGISDHFDPDDDNDGIIDAIECASVTVLINGGFDDGPSFNMQDQSTVPGWNTTASDGQIEIWGNGFQSVPSVEGPGQAELNANVSGALYQTVSTTPGQNIIWSVYHRKRGTAGAASEILNVKVSSGASISSSSTLFTSTAVNGVWSFYSGVYSVPAGQTTTTFFFEGAGGSGSFGNIIDEISFSEPSNSCLQDTDGDG
ncbi:MAG: lectin-like protein, partial [Flavobacteriales bacterium]